MDIKSDQITAVDSEGNVSYTVPEETKVVLLEELRQEAEQAQWEFTQAEEVLARATEKRDAAQSLYDAALALQEK